MTFDFFNAFTRIDQYIRARMAATHTPAMTLALYDRQKTQYIGTYGHVDLAGRHPVTANTLFQIGSISKTFTAVAVVKAAESGLLDLHAPITDYLPWFEVHSQFGPITSHHLLNHTAGVIRDNDLAPDTHTGLFHLRETEAGWEPGEQFHYSNAGYQILSRVLEVAAGRPIQEIIQDWILDPLGMAATDPVITHANRPRMAEGGRPLFDDRPTHPSQPTVPADWVEYRAGDGCIASTAGDMARFGRMLLNQGRAPEGFVLSSETYESMLQNAVSDGDGSYGYGLALFEFDGHRYLGHAGSMPGYESGMWIDRDHEIGIALLSATPYPMGSIWDVLDYWRAISLGETPAADALSLPNPSRIENAGEYTGAYSSGAKQFQLVAEGDRLVLQTGDDRVTLEKRGEDRFFADHPAFSLFLLRFGREDERVVEATHGGEWYLRDGSSEESRIFDIPERWDAYPGHYRAHNPWLSNFRVVARKGSLWLILPDGDEEVLTPLGDGLFRPGEEESPERLQFDQIVDGEALRATLSGCPYYRFFTP